MRKSTEDYKEITVDEALRELGTDGASSKLNKGAL
jgi:hypothetical protein